MEKRRPGQGVDFAVAGANGRNVGESQDSNIKK